MWQYRRIRKSRRPSIMPGSEQPVADQPILTVDLDHLTVVELRKSVAELWRSNVSDEHFQDIFSILNLSNNFKFTQARVGSVPQCRERRL